MNQPNSDFSQSNNFFLFLIGFGLTMLIAWNFIIPTTDSEPEIESQAVHYHADFAVYLDEEKVDFTQQKYQSTEEIHLDEYTHLHDGVGHVMHFHANGITVDYFFSTLGITLTDDCLTMDTGEQYCSDTINDLDFYVNGEPVETLVDYVPTDLDQILISYGSSEAQITSQLDQLTDDACIYSEVCPERGTPPTENCVGGLGSQCEI